MAIELTARAEILSKKQKVEQQIILEIPAFPNLIFGAFKVTKVAKIGEDGLTIGDFIIGGIIEDERQKSYISFKGSTRQFTQQLLPDRGGSGSVTRLKLRLIDKNDELTALFQPGANIPDLLGERAVTYLNMVGGAHPDDSVELLDGVIDDYRFGAGFIDLLISAPEQKKRVDLLSKVQTSLDGAIDAATTTVTLTDNAEDLILPQNELTSFIIVDQEIIQYTGVSGQALTGVVRGARGSVAATHDDNADINSLYYLTDASIPLALKVMLSDGGNDFASDIVANAINQTEATIVIQNAIQFTTPDAEKFYGLVPGDFISSSGSAEGANNFTDRVILSFGTNNVGSYIVVDGADLVTETETTAVIALKSQFNTLPEGAGCAMTPQQVDVPRHQSIEATFSASFPSFDIPINETIDGQTLINERIYMPSGLYQVPRARASVNYAAPPLALSGTQKLTLQNVHNISKLSIKRSTTENFYNRVLYNFNYDPITQRTRSSLLRTSKESKVRVKVGAKTLRVDARGVPESERALILTQVLRLLKRYRFGAESLSSVEISYSEGLKIEIGDAVIFGEPDMKLSDSKSGTRAFAPRLFEVVNKGMSLANGDFKLTILDTGFNLDGRFGTISPASKVGPSPLQGLLPLTNVFGVSTIKTEEDKWTNYIGQPVRVRSEDYLVSENTFIVGFSPISLDVAILDPPLTITPLEGYTIECPRYPDAGDFWKELHTFKTPQVDVVSGIDLRNFTVAPADINKFIVDKVVSLHNELYTEESNEVKVESIDTGTNTVTVDADLNFIPNNTHVVELIGFASDNGSPYRIL